MAACKVYRTLQAECFALELFFLVAAKACFIFF